MDAEEQMESPAEVAAGASDMAAKMREMKAKKAAAKAAEAVEAPSTPVPLTPATRDEAGAVHDTAAVTVAAPAESSESPWQKVMSSDGKVYYHNALTQETKWDIPAEGFRPAAPAAAAAPAAQPAKEEVEDLDPDPREEEDYNPDSPWMEYLPDECHEDDVRGDTHSQSSLYFDGNSWGTPDEEPEDGVSSSWRAVWSVEHSRYSFRNMTTKEYKWEYV